MELWDHQRRGLNEVAENIRAGVKRQCLVSPTGGGKTLMATTWMTENPDPTVFYTYRRMLLEQTSSVFAKRNLEHGLIAAGKKKSPFKDIQLAMIQTQVNRLRKGSPVHTADYVLVDEFHNNVNPTSMAVFEEHEDAYLIGFTATPLNIGASGVERLVIAGTNSELRECGAHVPAMTYCPDEPSSKIVGKVDISDGECGIAKDRRMDYVYQVCGRIAENYWALNPQQTPTILFAPDVASSVYLCNQLTGQGIPSAHIDSRSCIIDGHEIPSSQEAREEIQDRLERGDIKIVCNRFVLREGVDWPFVGHCIFATVFGSMTAYLQAGGRVIRAHPSLEQVTIQDHGGNFWRFGSLNSNREWSLGLTNSVMMAARLDAIREKKEPEPIYCPECNAVRLRGPKCFSCGHMIGTTERMVLQPGGALKPQQNRTLKPRRKSRDTAKLRKDWESRVRACIHSKKEHVRNRTYSQIAAAFARDNNWCWPRGEWPMTPRSELDKFRPVCKVKRWK